MTISATTIKFDSDGVYEALSALDLPCYVARMGDRVGAGNEAPSGATLLAAVPPCPPPSSARRRS